jgi:hypothetical protein
MALRATAAKTTPQRGLRLLLAVLLLQMLKLLKLLQ